MSSNLGNKRNVKIFVLYLMENINYPMDFVTINDVAEKYNGGGHDCASGATVHSRKEMKALIKDADAKLADYKANNEGWL